MQQEMSVLKARILICLTQMGRRSSNVTHLSEVFCVAKSTISRSVDWFEKKNLLSRNPDRTISLTDYGYEIAMDYSSKREIYFSWLISEGLQHKIAEQDALILAVESSNETVAIIRKYNEIRQLKKFFGNSAQMNGKDLCEQMHDGIYPFDFMFFKQEKYNSSSLSPSMANAGFDSSGELTVKNGNGLISLNAKQVEHISILGSLKVKGILRNMQYLAGKEYKEAGKEGNTYFFPASSLNFVRIGKNNIIQGSVRVKLSCSAGKVHMPDSEAFFVLYL